MLQSFIHPRFPSQRLLDSCQATAQERIRVDVKELDALIEPVWQFLSSRERACDPSGSSVGS
jgi:hypothetical protein